MASLFWLVLLLTILILYVGSSPRSRKSLTLKMDPPIYSTTMSTIKNPTSKLLTKSEAKDTGSTSPSSPNFDVIHLPTRWNSSIWLGKSTNSTSSIPKDNFQTDFSTLMEPNFEAKPKTQGGSASSLSGMSTSKPSRKPLSSKRKSMEISSGKKFHAIT